MEERDGPLKGNPEDYAKMVMDVLEECKPKPCNQKDLEIATSLKADEILAAFTALSRACKITKHIHAQTKDLYIALASPQEQEILQLESKCSTPNEKRVIRQIYESASIGVTQRQLASSTNIESREVRKIVAALSKSGLIKSQKGVKAKNLNFYLLASVVPDKAKFGGFFHDTDSLQLKTNVVADLQKAVQVILTRSPDETAPLEQIYTLLPQVLDSNPGIADDEAQVPIERGDIDKLLELLELDGLIRPVEEIRGKTVVKFIKLEKVKRRGDTGLLSVPCCRCPVASDCSDTGDITPAKCEYLNEWLDF